MEIRPVGCVKGIEVQCRIMSAALCGRDKLLEEKKLLVRAALKKVLLRHDKIMLCVQHALKQCHGMRLQLSLMD